MSENKGKLIYFEGNEGSGKSTLCKMAYDYLKENNVDCIMVREPGGCESAEKIRNLIFENDFDPYTELMLYNAARRELYKNVVKPALEAGKVVLSDRSYHTAMIYQGYIDKIDEMDNIEEMAFKAMDINYFDEMIIVRADPKIALERIKNRDDNNKNDLKDISWHWAVHNAYAGIIGSCVDHVITSYDIIDESFAKVKVILNRVIDIKEDDSNIDNEIMEMLKNNVYNGINMHALSNLTANEMEYLKNNGFNIIDTYDNSIKVVTWNKYEDLKNEDNKYKYILAEFLKNAMDGSYSGFFKDDDIYSDIIYTLEKDGFNYKPMYNNEKKVSWKGADYGTVAGSLRLITDAKVKQIRRDNK